MHQIFHILASYFDHFCIISPETNGEENAQHRFPLHDVNITQKTVNNKSVILAHYMIA